MYLFAFVKASYALNRVTGFFFVPSYTMDAPELHHRRLGDLAFLVQHFDLAYNSYHSAKRDFNNDHAWVYFAGALVSSMHLCSVHLFTRCIVTVYSL